MSLKFEKLMDRIGCRILEILAQDGRISYSSLGRKVGLSTPAVTERVRKMEEAGLILGYQARIRRDDEVPAILAFMELTTQAGLYDQVKKKAQDLAQVLECHHTSGQASFILKVRAASTAELEAVVAAFSPLGHTKTSVVLSSVKAGG